jgi:hypothetical protein
MLGRTAPQSLLHQTEKGQGRAAVRLAGDGDMAEGICGRSYDGLGVGQVLAMDACSQGAGRRGGRCPVLVTRGSRGAGRRSGLCLVKVTRTQR